MYVVRFLIYFWIMRDLCSMRPRSRIRASGAVYIMRSVRARQNRAQIYDIFATRRNTDVIIFVKTRTFPQGMHKNTEPGFFFIFPSWVLRFEYWVMSIVYWVLDFQELCAHFQRTTSTQFAEKVFAETNYFPTLANYLIFSAICVVPLLWHVRFTPVTLSCHIRANTVPHPWHNIFRKDIYLFLREKRLLRNDGRNAQQGVVKDVFAGFSEIFRANCKKNSKLFCL